MQFRIYWILKKSMELKSNKNTFLEEVEYFMDVIKNWFKDNGYEVDEYETTLQAKTDTILFLVVEPHNGTNGKWMLRAAALASFDRWANSTAVEEFFDTEIGLYNYLGNNQLYIYKDVLRSLSDEYEEMYRVNYED